MPKIVSHAKLAAIASEKARFVQHLRHSGNASMAAAYAGRSREAFNGRRRADGEFDAECAAAIAFARAALARKGGTTPAPGDAGSGLVARGGEYHVGANANNGLQVRRARAGHVTAAGEAAFLEALSATANIRLAADVVGVDPRVFYKRRAQSGDFARRMQDALAAGYEAVEFALLKSALRSLAPQGMPEDYGEAAGAGPVTSAVAMSIDQALALVAQRTKTMAIGERHARGDFERRATPEETDALLNKRPDALQAHLKRNPQLK